ncbi:MAG: ATP-binding protein, partial [Synergistaceae bacterium]|nr:ATP-binding protein [Synergistaceae bacterium]
YADASLPRGGGNMLFYGPPGTGKTALAKYIAGELGRDCVVKRASDIWGWKLGESEKNVANAFREAEATGAILVIDEADTFLHSRETAQYRWELSTINEFLTSLEEHKGFCICTTNMMKQMDDAVMRRFSFKVPFTYAKPEQVMALYSAHLATLVDEDLPDALELELHGMRRLAPGDFHTVKSQYWLSEPGEVSHEELVRALKREQDIKLDRKERKKAEPEEGYTLSGVCLDGSVDELLEKCRRADAVYANASLPKNGGNMLFYGPSGTGKTALAKYIAFELGRDCVVKRASDILSSKVGESEKIVADVFREAEETGAVLVIDEADTFLYSRETAQHRWESSIVNEFLTSLEEFKGFCICTTNMMDQLDAAVMRRFSFKERFVYAGTEQVIALYSSLLAPLAGGELPRDLERELRGMKLLAPGDFHVVKSLHWLAEPGEISHEELVRGLKREQEMKPDGKERRVGFSL